MQASRASGLNKRTLAPGAAFCNDNFFYCEGDVRQRYPPQREPMPCATKLPCSNKSSSSFPGTASSIMSASTALTTTSAGSPAANSSSPCWLAPRRPSGAASGDRGAGAELRRAALVRRQAPARSSLSDAVRARPAELFFDLLRELIGQLSRTLRRVIKAAVPLIDATQLNVGQLMQHWLGLHKGTVATKLHVVYDPAAQKPVYFDITPARINNITAAKDLLPIEPVPPMCSISATTTSPGGRAGSRRLHLRHPAEDQHAAARGAVAPGRSRRGRAVLPGGPAAGSALLQPTQ